MSYFSEKKDVCEATQAKGLTPHLEEKKAVQAAEFSRPHVQRNQGRTNSQERKEGSRSAIPCRPWFLEPQKQAEGLEGSAAMVTLVQCVPLGTFPRLRSSRIPPQAAL